MSSFAELVVVLTKRACAESGTVCCGNTVQGSSARGIVVEEVSEEGVVFLYLGSLDVDARWY